MDRLGSRLDVRLRVMLDGNLRCFTLLGPASPARLKSSYAPKMLHLIARLLLARLLFSQPISYRYRRAKLDRPESVIVG